MNDDPAAVRDAFFKNPDQLALLKQNNPTLADALLSGNLGNYLSFLYYCFFSEMIDQKLIFCSSFRNICYCFTKTNSNTL